MLYLYSTGDRPHITRPQARSSLAALEWNLMRQPRLAIAQPDIVRLLDQHSLRIFRRSDLEKVLADNREYLRLTRSTTTSRFIDFLLARTRLKMVKLKFPSRKEVRYILGDVSPYALALSIRPRSYLTHYSAMHIHGLTEQIPKTVYVNAEQPQKRVPNASLTQERIDAAFRHPPRKSKNRAVLPGVTVCLLAGMHTGQLGVIQAKIPTGETVSVTNIERTLIDIVVRPFYAGGIYEVLEAYRRARGSLSINKLVATLKKLDLPPKNCTKCSESSSRQEGRKGALV